MGIDVQLRKESGDVIDEVGDPKWYCPVLRTRRFLEHGC